MNQQAMSSVEWLRTIPAVGSSLRVPGTYDLDLDLEPDPFANQQAAGLENLVPGDVPILALDLGRGREASPLAGHGVVPPTEELHIERHGPGDVPDREVAHELEGGTAYRSQLGTLEPDLGEPFDSEEVVALQVVVAHLHAGLDAGYVDLHFGVGILGLLRDLDRAGE